MTTNISQQWGTWFVSCSVYSNIAVLQQRVEGKLCMENTASDWETAPFSFSKPKQALPHQAKQFVPSLFNAEWCQAGEAFCSILYALHKECQPQAAGCSSEADHNDIQWGEIGKKKKREKKSSSIIINTRCRPIKQPFLCAHRRALTHNLPKQIHV